MNVSYLAGKVGEVSSEKVTMQYDHRRKRGVNQITRWRKSIPGRGISMYKGPVARGSMEEIRSSIGGRDRGKGSKGLFLLSIPRP